ncbi:hypothetical protein AMS68_006897 [Peltaster fructicola]|uniref:Uncharacterized protein n=1 Tax=Peltaster fructicola TaxID=286661 RepID=A0A6H0Y439_9PEZI|nr:hypothetical protein AMS68_006897 [Peltaster fructicola]
MGQVPSTTAVSSAVSTSSSITSYPPSRTFVNYVPAAIITSTVSKVGTVYTPAPVTTGYTTLTGPAKYVLSQVPVSKTITIPTVSGFTPLRCEATYQQPTPPTTTLYTTVTTTSGSAESSSLTAITDTIETIYTATVTLPAVYFLGVTSTITPTSTITRTNPTSTVWAACNANNVVQDHPYGHGYLGYAFPREPNIEVDSISFSPTDCCERCQANATCFGSAYFPLLDVPCKLFLLDPQGSQTCDPSYNGGRIDYSTQPLPTPYIYVGNGGCGQVQFYDD